MIALPGSIPNFACRQCGWVPPHVKLQHLPQLGKPSQTNDSLAGLQRTIQEAKDYLRKLPPTRDSLQRPNTNKAHATLQYLTDIENIFNQNPSNQDFILNFPPFVESALELQNVSGHYSGDLDSMYVASKGLKIVLLKSMQALENGIYLPGFNSFVLRNGSQAPTKEQMKLLSGSLKYLYNHTPNLLENLQKMTFINFARLDGNHGESFAAYPWINIEWPVEYNALTYNKTCNLASLLWHELQHQNAPKQDLIILDPDIVIDRQFIDSGFLDPKDQPLFTSMDEIAAWLKEVELATTAGFPDLDGDTLRGMKTTLGVVLQECSDPVGLEGLTPVGRKWLENLKAQYHRLFLAI